MTTTDIIGVLRADGDGKAVRLEWTYDTEVEDLWSAITERDRLARWFSRVEGDLTLGGEFLIMFSEDDPTQRTAGTVLECQAPNRLVVRWRFAEEDDSTVTVELSAVADGAHLVLEHARLPTRMAAGYGAGWQAYVEQLAVHFRGEEPHGAEWDEREVELLAAYQAQLET